MKEFYIDCDDFKAIIPLSPALIIPDDARKGSILGMTFDPEHIPELLSNDEWELSGDFVRVAQTINPEAAIMRYNGEVLLIHGDEDDHIYSWHLDKVQEAIKDFFRA